LNNLINAALDNSWEKLHTGDNFVTPDNIKGSPFSIEAIDNNSVVITTNGGAPININRQAFIAVVRYLIDNLHSEQNPCAIGSNKTIEDAGPLCVTARNANESSTMIINYLLPLLSSMGLVNIDGNRPNKTWLI
jgi:hypothetical protein